MLSLDTGHRRDYSEGAAYRTYFGTDDLMFRVSNVDRRLANKEEVLVLRLADPGGGRPAASRWPSPRGGSPASACFHHAFAGRNLVIVTSPGGRQPCLRRRATCASSGTSTASASPTRPAARGG